MNTAQIEHPMEFVPVTYWESEVVSPGRRIRVPVAIRENEHLYELCAKMPGFTAEELEVRAEPFRLFITGKRDCLIESRSGNRSGKIFEAIDLSCEIDVRSVIAEWNDGELTVSMRKIPGRKIVQGRKASSLATRNRSAELHRQAEISKRYSQAAKEQLHRAAAWNERALARATAELNKMHAQSELNPL